MDPNTRGSAPRIDRRKRKIRAARMVANAPCLDDQSRPQQRLHATSGVNKCRQRRPQRGHANQERHEPLSGNEIPRNAHLLAVENHRAIGGGPSIANWARNRATKLPSAGSRILSSEEPCNSSPCVFLPVFVSRLREAGVSVSIRQYRQNRVGDSFG